MDDVTKALRDVREDGRVNMLDRKGVVAVMVDIFDDTEELHLCRAAVQVNNMTSAEYVKALLKI